MFNKQVINRQGFKCYKDLEIIKVKYIIIQEIIKYKYFKIKTKIVKIIKMYYQKYKIKKIYYKKY